MKKKLIIFTGIILIILMISFFPRPKTKTAVPSPSPTPFANNQFDVNEFSATESAQQIKNDLKYGQAIESLHQKYPWYSRLPIETDDFRIIYDFDEKNFRIRLLTQSSESIKQTAVSKLKEIGVDLKKFSYYFIEP